MLMGSDFEEEYAREVAEQESDNRRKAEPAPELSPEEFLSWRSPREAEHHPVRLDNPLWHWLVRTRWSAYHANNTYSGPSSFDAGPAWCFERFGKSETSLPNGDIIHIGGEHEDHYDPDFHIYNDVTVIKENGEIAIHGYPLQDFPGTDFHSATLVGETIFIVGRLGHPKQRVAGTTPVYKLELNSMRISSLKTYGDQPGWIYGHSAILDDDSQSVIVRGGERWLSDDLAISENVDSWSLNTLTGEWKRLTKHDWQRWTMQRMDRKPSRLWDVRQALWHRDHAHLGLNDYWKFDDSPDFAALEMLYRLNEKTAPPVEGTEHNVFIVTIDELTIRFKESRFWIEAIVEGRLAEDSLLELQRKTLVLLERLEASPCKIVVRGEDQQV